MVSSSTKVMLLAAGKGERMRPLTLTTPKPLLQVGGKPLLQWHIETLITLGVRDFVINSSWLGEQIRTWCGNGATWGVSIQHSVEEEPLETAGGIIQALPLLGGDPFLVVNADIWTAYPFASLLSQMPPVDGAHLVLVDNPAHNSQGDFLLREGMVTEKTSVEHEMALTYSGIGLYDPGFFAGCTPGKRPLLPLLERAIREQRLAGEHYRGAWTDVGTPERLAALDEQLQGSA